MADDKPDVLLVGNRKPVIVNGLTGHVNLHFLAGAPDPDAFIKSVGDKIRGVAVGFTSHKIDAALMQRLPKLEIVSTFGVGYDHVDVKYAAAHGIVVTNTPEVLNEEVADTALGLLLCTVRELPQAERHVRSGKWAKTGFPLTRATLRNRTVGLVGMGRISQAIARRLAAFNMPIVYHSRNPQPGVPYKHYPKLLDMARDVDTMILIVPGGASTKNIVNQEVLEALGPDGILINMARGSVVDERALIDALKNKTILSAGLDVYLDEPNVSPELIALDNVVLLPHVGSASVHTRNAMDQRVVDNILAWASGKPPISSVPETPWPPRR